MGINTGSGYPERKRILWYRFRILLIRKRSWRLRVPCDCVLTSVGGGVSERKKMSELGMSERWI